MGKLCRRKVRTGIGLPLGVGGGGAEGVMVLPSEAPQV